MIYLDHAATSWPKPEPVVEAVTRALTECANPGRGGHPPALAAGRAVLAAREGVAAVLNVKTTAAQNIVFGRNTTEAINLGLRGLLKPGDRVVTTPAEHNAVMRPLRELERQGVRIEILKAAPDGTADLAAARNIMPGARMLVVCHASNVLGAIQPLADLGELARRAGALFMVDAAQTAGALPLDLDSLPIDLLAFPGHKGLLGPQGTGGLFIRPELELPPLVSGGTGSLSELEDMPGFAPDRYEAGTPNVPGLAGLAAAAEYLLQIGVENIRQHEEALLNRFLEGVTALKSVRILGPADAKHRAGLVCLNMNGADPKVLAEVLEKRYAIWTRAGLHCAPAAHRHADTWPEGAVRFSFGWSTTVSDVEAALAALTELDSRL